MKKSTVKLLSACLVLVLLLSVLPMAAFAADTNEHEHIDCCAEESSAWVVCDHMYYVVHTGYYYTSNGASGHTAKYANLLTCSKCGYQKLEILDTFGESHTMVSGMCTKCGYTG